MFVCETEQVCSSEHHGDLGREGEDRCLQEIKFEEEKNI
jgi:hypothetical protein